MSLGLTFLTWAHVALSLAGILSGLAVLFGLLTARRLDGWTSLFLWTTLATSVTGFLLPFHTFLPSHGVGVVSLLVLPISYVARYRRRLAGFWRVMYVVTAMTALYLNVFVLIVQAFLKVPALNAIAPAQSDPPFVVTQLFVLAIFVSLTIAAAVRFRAQRPADPVPVRTV